MAQSIWWIYPAIKCKIAIKIVDLPIYSEFFHEKWWIFPVRYVNVYQRLFEDVEVEGTSKGSCRLEEQPMGIKTLHWITHMLHVWYIYLLLGDI